MHLFFFWLLQGNIAYNSYHYMRKTAKRRLAFTLVEMLIVIVIVGILSAALIPKVQSIQARARDSKRKIDIRTVQNALIIYRENNGGKYPYPYHQYGIRNMSGGGWLWVPNRNRDEAFHVTFST